jgi:hypothetical protein
MNVFSRLNTPGHENPERLGHGEDQRQEEQYL